MKLILSLLACFTLLTGCNEEENVASNFVTITIISVKNTTGEDLLNPDHPDAFLESEIKIFYEIEGKAVEIFDPNMSIPRNFNISKEGDLYLIGIFLNDIETEEHPVTYVQWNEFDTDTLKAEFVRRPNSISVSKVWFNGELRWNRDGTFFEIIK